MKGKESGVGGMGINIVSETKIVAKRKLESTRFGGTARKRHWFQCPRVPRGCLKGDTE